MGSNTGEKIDELANDLEEMKTTVDEIADDPASSGSSQTIDRLKTALDQASDAAEELENEQE